MCQNKQTNKQIENGWPTVKIGKKTSIEADLEIA